MKSPLRKDLEPTTGSFTVKVLVEPHFDPKWHFHPHYQLFLVEEGTGTRFIGDSIKPYGPGDLVFLGPNLPHLWRSDQVYFDQRPTPPCTGLMSRGIVVYFSEDFLGADFLARQEMASLGQLLTNARWGLEWTGCTRERAKAALRDLASQPVGFGRVLALLTLLHELSGASDYRYLTSPGYTNNVKPTEPDAAGSPSRAYRRMQVVHDYVLSHFPDELSLETVADLAGMTAPAFCRYFKARANKTFSEFVSEVRVGHACKLLIQGKLSITQISFESGFRTLSNFNRQFKEITGQTPSTYMKTYRQIG